MAYSRLIMDDSLLERYSKQVMLPEIDISGQKRLLDASVLIVGAGGLGNPTAMYLAAAGVGRIILNDFDEVSLSNLPRQVFFTENDIGRLKVESLSESIRGNNSNVKIETISNKLSVEQLTELANRCDLILDCTDNYNARHSVSKAAKNANIPLVSGAAIRTEGLLMVLLNNTKDSPCYGCFSSNTGDSTETCSTSGILGPAVASVASLQVTEAIKLLIGNQAGLINEALAIDFMSLDIYRFDIIKNPSCKYC